MTTVADTAFFVAALRAQESARPDALFSDPLAARLAGESGRAFVESLSGRGAMMGWTVVVRTVLIDRFVLEAVARGAKTVLNLGAGLDTRPYRLDLPASLGWVEVDQAPVIAHKDAALAGETPRCRLERVAVDLTDGAARRELLARVARQEGPALVLTEGVLPYLTEPDVATLLDDLGRHDAFRSLVADYFAPEVVRARNAAPATGAIPPLRFAPDDWRGFFAARGWTVKELADLAAEGARRGRPFVMPGMPGGPAAPTRGAFAAYALLERSVSPRG